MRFVFTWFSVWHWYRKSSIILKKEQTSWYSGASLYLFSSSFTEFGNIDCNRLGTFPWEGLSYTGSVLLRVEEYVCLGIVKLWGRCEQVFMNIPSRFRGSVTWEMRSQFRDLGRTQIFRQCAFSMGNCDSGDIDGEKVSIFFGLALDPAISALKLPSKT